MVTDRIFILASYTVNIKNITVVWLGFHILLKLEYFFWHVQTEIVHQNYMNESIAFHTL